MQDTMELRAVCEQAGKVLICLMHYLFIADLCLELYLFVLLYCYYNGISEIINMNKQETQTEFEALCFMHEAPQEKREDYIDTYAKPPCPCEYKDRFCNTCE